MCLNGRQGVLLVPRRDVQQLGNLAIWASPAAWLICRPRSFPACFLVSPLWKAGHAHDVSGGQVKAVLPEYAVNLQIEDLTQEQQGASVLILNPAAIHNSASSVCPGSSLRSASTAAV